MKTRLKVLAMGLSKYNLKDLIELCDERNTDNVYTLDDVKGISIKKEFIETKADMSGVSLTPYILVRPDSFAYVTVTSRNGEKITLAHNTSDDTCIVSSSYVVFKVSKPEILLSDYLFMFFNRPEFDRYSRFNSWGSARETFSWDDFRDIDITLPTIEQQRKYVDVYLSLQKNLEAYQSKVDELKLVCDGFIEDLRRKTKCKRIGEYIKRYDVRNGKNGTTNVMGVSITKEFREPSSKVNRNDLANYKVCHPGDIAFVQTTNNEKCFAYAYNNTPKDIVVSQVDEVFTTDRERLNPEYLSMFFNRKEFDRYARFHSWGSARETFTWEDVCQVQIPIPNIDIQRSIASIYKVYKERKAIAAQLKEQLNNLCPILIKGSLEA